jgi:hypothetical protein
MVPAQRRASGHSQDWCSTKHQRMGKPDRLQLARIRSRGKNMLKLIVSTLAAVMIQTANGWSMEDDDAVWEIGESIGEMAGRAISSFEEMESSRAGFESRISRARAEFWRTYPDKPGHAAAKDTFATALWEKDLYYQALGIWRELQSNPRDIERIFKLPKIDGGIRPHASTAFDAWSRAIIGELNVATDFKLLNAAPHQYHKAVSASKAKYGVYLVMRDQSEFLAKGVDIYTETGMRSILVPHFALVQEVSLEEGVRSFRDFEELFGSQNISSIWKRLCEAGIGTDGIVDDLKPLGLFQVSRSAAGAGPQGLKPVYNSDAVTVFMEAVKQSGPREWILFNLKKGPYGSSWKNLDRKYASEYGKYPRQSVLETADKLRNRSYTLGGAPIGIADHGI